MLRVGDIVIDSRSRAENISRKAYRVKHIDANGWGPAELISPKGNVKTAYSTYRYKTEDEYERHLSRELAQSERELEDAHKRVAKRKKAQNDFQKDKNQLTKLFPKI